MSALICFSSDGPGVGIDERQETLRLARTSAGGYDDFVVTRAADSADELAREIERPRHFTLPFGKFKEFRGGPESASAAIELVADDNHAACGDDRFDRGPAVAEMVRSLDDGHLSRRGVEPEHGLGVGQVDVVLVENRDVLQWGNQRQHLVFVRRTFGAGILQILELERFLLLECLGIDDHQRTVAGFARTHVGDCGVIAQYVDLASVHVEILRRVAHGRTVHLAVDVLLDRTVRGDPGNRTVFHARSPLVEKQHAVRIGISADCLNGRFEPPFPPPLPFPPLSSSLSDEHPAAATAAHRVKRRLIHL